MVNTTYLTIAIFSFITGFAVCIAVGIWVGCHSKYKLVKEVALPVTDIEIKCTQVGDTLLVDKFNATITFQKQIE